MKLQYRITFADYKAAQALHRRQKLIRQLDVLFGPAMLFVALCLFIASSITKSDELSLLSGSLTAGGTVATIASFLARLFVPWKNYRSMFSPKRTSSITTLEVDEQKVVEIEPGGETVSINWTAVYDFLQNHKVAMIYTRTNRFIIIPASALTTANRAELEKLVAQYVKGPVK